MYMYLYHDRRVHSGDSVGRGGFGGLSAIELVPQRSDLLSHLKHTTHLKILVHDRTVTDVASLE